MVSPGPLSIEPKKSRRFPHHRLAHQPVDLREGVAKAYSVVKEVGGPRVGQARLLPCFLAVTHSVQWLSFIPRRPWEWAWGCSQQRVHVCASGKDRACGTGGLREEQ